MRADLVRAQTNSDCTSAPNATGIFFDGLEINGTPVEKTPSPNTVIDLTFAKVILNEQRPASDGRGIVVNAIHVISPDIVDPLFRGDIIVAHAMSTLSCPNGAASTGTDSPVRMTKTPVPTSATPGSQVTYTAVFTNDASSACLVNEAVDHLPVGVEPVSTAGDLGTAWTVRARPGGGTDLIVGNDDTIGAGASATQSFTVKVGDSAQPGTYFNNVELLCSNLGNFVKGRGPPRSSTTTEPPPQNRRGTASPLPQSRPQHLAPGSKRARNRSDDR